MADVSLGTVMARARGERRVRRHGRDPHLRPRRHVRLARPALEGAVRLRGDHARAVRGEGARRDAAGHADRRARHARRPRVDDRLARRGRPASQPSLKGVDLSPVLADPSARVRDHVLFAHDTAHTNRINNTRYAIRGFFDGRTKYARATTASAAASPAPGCGARTPAASSTTSTPTSPTRNTSGTTSPRIPTSS